MTYKKRDMPGSNDNLKNWPRYGQLTDRERMDSIQGSNFSANTQHLTAHKVCNFRIRHLLKILEGQDVAPPQL